jgi:hypothetical protein
MPYLLKLDRAEEHLLALERETEAWISANVQALAIEEDAYTGDYILRARVLGQPPDRWGALIGDCLFNLRAALDHLAFDLAFAFARGPLSKGVTERSEFPIFRDRPTGNKVLSDRIGGIDPGAQTIIDGLQPYQRGADYHSHPLWALHELNNIDKHRVHHLTVAADQGGSFRLKNARFVNEPVYRFGGLHENAEIIRYRVAAIDPEQEMEVNFKPTFLVSMTQTSGDVLAPVVGLLRKITGYIRMTVLPPLVPFL